MNPEVKAQWVAALKSDKYRQGSGRLWQLQPDPLEPEDADKNGLCCLGVLCEIAFEQGIVERKITRNERGVVYMVYGGSWDFLPTAVMEWAGLSVPDPRVGEGDKSMKLSMYNDQGVSFLAIAEEIEQSL